MQPNTTSHVTLTGNNMFRIANKVFMIIFIYLQECGVSEYSYFYSWMIA